MGKPRVQFFLYKAMQAIKAERTNGKDFGYRRNAQRYICSLEGSYYLSPGENNPLRCENISSRGARIIIPEPIPRDVFLTLELKTSDKGSVITEAKVCWSRWLAGCWKAGVNFNRPLALDISKFV